MCIIPYEAYLQTLKQVAIIISAGYCPGILNGVSIVMPHHACKQVDHKKTLLRGSF
jgi:hypothetical protein